MSAAHSPQFIEEIKHHPSKFVKVVNILTIMAMIVCYGFIGYVLIFHFDFVKYFFTDYSKLQTFINPDLKLPIFILAMLFSIVVSVNPLGQAIPITSIIAFFYGFPIGLLFGCLTFFCETCVIMSISRHMGSSTVKKIIGQKNWKKVEILANEEGILPFFIAYLFPVFPNSIISYVAGITHVPIFKSAIFALLGQFPGIVLSVLVGSGVITENIYLTVGLFIALVTVAFLMNRYRKNILDLINQTK